MNAEKFDMSVELEMVHPMSRIRISFSDTYFYRIRRKILKRHVSVGHVYYYRFLRMPQEIINGLSSTSSTRFSIHHWCRGSFITGTNSLLTKLIKSTDATVLYV
jgi:hypothetical protein